DHMQDVVLTTEIDAGGNFVKVSGYDTLLTLLKESLSPEIITQMEKSGFIKEAGEQEKKYWDDNIGFFVGKQMAVGDHLVDITQIKLPNEVYYDCYVVHTLTKLVKVDNVECAQIESSFFADADALRKELGGEHYIRHVVVNDVLNAFAITGERDMERLHSLSISRSRFGESSHELAGEFLNHGERTKSQFSPFIGSFGDT
ncbi:MAG: hypothetical protein M1283_04130, partial [Gammaproteobacteria bacterium]|nr:hypothetical protein [Gammaproteobacteria bacterium]